MIYLTQLIFVKPGKEAIFHQFEELAIPLLSQYNGRILYRIRPEKEQFVTASGEIPYEVHFLSFDSQQDFEAFMQDDSRLAYIHLKEESVKSMLLFKGEKLF